jgi:predicted aminopeptidase
MEMTIRGRKISRAGKCWLAVLLGVMLVAFSGCKTFRFYTQAAKGQYQLMAHRQPVQKLLTNSGTSQDLKQQLELLQNLRAFAQDKLHLPVDGHYTKYVDVHRRFVVWNVEAAPEFSLEPKSWWYPLVGRLEYRGYFSEEHARKYAAELTRKGDDVHVGGVSAYSTLGWFKDPVLNTFIFNPEADLAETIFHELAHQRVFARGDMDFNEAFATTVGEEGARRWLRAKNDSAIQENYAAQLRRTREFVHLVLQARQRLQVIYGDELDDEGKVRATDKNRGVAPERLRQQKQEVLAQLRADYAQLKASWGGQTEYDHWFTQSINNAQLNSVAAYYELVPAFERLLELNGGDLEKFYVAAERLANKQKKERHQWLQNLAANPH